MMKSGRMWSLLAVGCLGMTGAQAWGRTVVIAPVIAPVVVAPVVAQPAVVAPAPFLYNNLTYVPLQTVAPEVGASFAWTNYGSAFAVTLGGQNFSLTIGSSNMLCGPTPYLLPGPPILVGQVVYVPSVFCQHYLRVPCRFRPGYMSFRGRHGWHEFAVSRGPRGHVDLGRHPYRGNGTHPNWTSHQGVRTAAQGPRPLIHGTRGSVRAGAPGQGHPRGQGHSKGQHNGHGRSNEQQDNRR